MAGLGIYLQGTKERLKILADYFLAARPDVIVDIVSSEKGLEDKAWRMLARRHTRY